MDKIWKLVACRQWPSFMWGATIAWLPRKQQAIYSEVSLHNSDLIMHFIIVSFIFLFLINPLKWEYLFWQKQNITFFAFHVTDLDPCINVSCTYFAVCKAFGPRDARCICVDNCPSYEEPVCSSNGTTYDNVCGFQREMCHLRANFTVYHPGDCTGNITEFTPFP